MGAAARPVTPRTAARPLRGVSWGPGFIRWGVTRAEPPGLETKRRVETLRWSNPTVPGLIVGAAVLSALYALGALLPFWYLASPEAGVAFFPAAGLTLAALLRTPRYTWPVWLLTVALTEIVVDVTHGQSYPMAFGFAVANTVEPLAGAIGILWAAKRWSTVRESLIGFLVIGAVLAPVLGGIVGATTAVLFSDPTVSWWTIAGRWWLGDALGVLVVATPLLAWTIRSPWEGVVAPFESAAIVLLATAASIIPALLWHHPLLYAVLPILMWAALRGGSRTVSAAGLGIAFATNWAAVTGRADQLISGQDVHHDLVFVQLFLAVTILAALVLAVEVADRRRGEAQVRDAVARQSRAERAAAQSAYQERKRIAMETHDIVGHALNVMLLHGAAARRALTSDVTLAQGFLASMESVGRDAFRDLDHALAIDEAVEPLSNRGIEDVQELVETMRGAQLSVSLSMDGPFDELPRLVSWSAYRIVQEALTNVTKHVPGAAASVTITTVPTMVSVLVADDGGDRVRKLTGAGVGRGLVGMRERVDALGGEFEAGPVGAGFVVRAELPVRTPQP